VVEAGELVTRDEHLKKAEELLEQAGEYNATEPHSVALVQRAQTHAWIALAKPVGRKPTPAELEQAGGTYL
jgi:hypothetical protein